MKFQAGTESSKSKERRIKEGFFTKYLKGKGLDIGHGGDPVTDTCDGWELDKGDATKLQEIPDSKYDWVYSSHLLEHLDEPEVALSRWWDILKPGGYLIVAVPDEDLYEKGVWPSIWNPDHRNAYTIKKASSWCPRSINLCDLLGGLPGASIEYIKRCSENGEYQIEAVVQKTSAMSQEWLKSTLGNAMCSTCRKDKMLTVCFYKNGNILLRCLTCGQFLTISMISILSRVGIKCVEEKPDDSEVDRPA